MNGQPNSASGAKAQKPPWLFPVIILVAIVSVALIGRRKREAIENPLVDLVIIAVGVYAIGAVFRIGAIKFNNPGLAAFFGANPPAATVPIS